MLIKNKIKISKIKFLKNINTNEYQINTHVGK